LPATLTQTIDVSNFFMKQISLFLDGSVHAQLKIGFGAYLIATEKELPLNLLKSTIKIKRFDNTSSTKLELQTLLWALDEISATPQKITIYTDAQNIIGLPTRRARLVQNNFYTSKNKLHQYHELYKTFYRVTDSLNYQLVKVKGHLPTKEKDNIAQLFSLVDKASRKALRTHIIEERLGK